jgi:sigma-E factor negative regulatory protein RseB
MIQVIQLNRYWRIVLATAGFFILVPYTVAADFWQALEPPIAYLQTSPEPNDSPQSQQDKVEPSLEPLEQSVETQVADVFEPLSASSWMQRLIRNTSDASFELVFVVSGNQRETIPYMWRRGKMPDESKIEQLSKLNGPGFEQVAHLGKLSIFEPGYAPYSVQSQNVQGPIPQAFIYAGADIAEAYDALLMGRNRITGRMAQQVRVISKDKTRFGYHLWLDEQTGLLLKLDMYDLDGSLLEQIQVTQLNISENVNNVFAGFSVDQLPQVSTRTAQASRELLWQVSYLPLGMKVIKQGVHRIERTGQMTEYMLLSDGLVDVSVYVMSANDAFQEDISLATGSNAVVSKTDGRVQVTVVGEIPVITADKIADSIVIIEPTND